MVQELGRVTAQAVKKSALEPEALDQDSAESQLPALVELDPAARALQAPDQEARLAMHLLMRVPWVAPELAWALEGALALAQGLPAVVRACPSLGREAANVPQSPAKTKFSASWVR